MKPYQGEKDDSESSSVVSPGHEISRPEDRDGGEVGWPQDEEKDEENFNDFLEGKDVTWRELSTGRPIPPPPAAAEHFEVAFLDNDPDQPENWNLYRKSLIIITCALSAMVVAWGSAVFSGSVVGVQQEFHVGQVVAALNISLYVAGFALGPVLWGPLSELTGRRTPMLIGLFGFMLFCFAGGAAKDFQTVVLSRFFMGTIGAASITVGPAMAADTFNSFERGRAIAFISLMITAGPMISPVVGGYIGASYLGWRWTQYITGIFAALALVICFVLLKETYPPKILALRASIMREETGNWAIFAPLEKKEVDTREIIQRTILKPISMLFVEPILLLISLYHGLVYGILYLCLEAVPLIFSTGTDRSPGYGWPGGNSFLPYLAMFVGTILIIATDIFYFEPYYVKKLKASGKPVVPEERLPLMALSGFFFPAGIFLLCWAGNYRVFWFVPCLGLVFIGIGIMGIFIAAFNYIIDSYLVLAASGIAANTFVRSGMGAAFPLFAEIMFKNLGTQWAGTLLGCLAAILIPVPFLFYFYGHRIRAMSKYAINTDENELESLTRRVSRTTAASSRRRSSVLAF